MRRIIKAILLCFCICLLSCSGQEPSKKLKVQASSVPQAEILEQIKEPLAEEGIALEIIVIDDYNIPNRALAEGDIDANFFQHKPFLDEQVKQFGYPITSLTGVHIEPMGLYMKKEGQFPSKQALIAIPSDPSNEARALLLLEESGLITLKKTSTHITVLDIEDNPLNLRFKEMDAAFLTRALQEVDGAIIPTNYALLAGLSPLKDALYVEGACSPYVNVIAVRKEDLQKPEIIALKRQIRSEKVRLFILETYKGTVTPLLKTTEDPAFPPETPQQGQDSSAEAKTQSPG